MKRDFQKCLLQGTVLTVLSVCLLNSCSSLYEITNKRNNNSQDIESQRNDGSSIAYSADSSDINIKKINLTNGDYVISSVGSPKILVIPIEIEGYEKNATASNKERIEKAFFGESEDTGWESVKSFYKKSSYGKLDIDGFVTDWWECGYTVDEIHSFSDSQNRYFQPTVRLLEEAVKWYKVTYDTKATDFDSDADGLIDGVWLVYGAPNYTKSSDVPLTFWAYTYSDYNLKSTSLLSPLGYRYSWASYDFMDVGYGIDSIDAHTYIHETGHMLGLDDYYVSKVSSSLIEKGGHNYSPTGQLDMMDHNILDHNSFSKLALGWASPQDGSEIGTYTLKPYEEGGDCLVIPSDNGWNGSAFDEYILVEFYTPSGLNQKDSDSLYAGNGLKGFTKKGIRIYHVDARMVARNNAGEFVYVDSVKKDANYIATYIAHSNSSAYNYVNPEYRLIQLLDATEKKNFDTDNDPSSIFADRRKKAKADDSSLFYEGNSFTFDSYKSSFPNYYYHNSPLMNNGSTFSKKITIDSIGDAEAKITIS